MPASDQRSSPKLLHKGRTRIEQAMGKLKRFKRIALGCEKTTENYSSLAGATHEIFSIDSAGIRADDLVL